MRLRNVKNASEKIKSSSYIIDNPEKYKGKFKQIFANENPIHIEIGMGKGNFIINNALEYESINFIGIEKYDSVMVRALEKLDDKCIPNLRLIRIDANKIEEIFNKEIDLIYLNFSDPWPKDRHANRRLTSPYFLDKYDYLFNNSKNIIMKTDNRKLFEYSIISFTNKGYKIKEISLDLHNDDVSSNIETEYEKKFSSNGFPIYKVIVYKD